jgi:MFS family permease
VSSSALARAVRRSESGAGRAQRAATFAVFVSHGLLFASWTAHIPLVKDHLGLSDATLGLALLGAPLGSVVAMLGVARVLPRLGSPRMVQVTLLGYCLAGPLVGLAGSFAALVAALFSWGAFQGALDVSMNTQAVTVERAAAQPLMSGFHGGWSIGAFAGAGIGTLGVAAGIPLTPQLLLLAVPVLAVAGLLSLRMLADPPPLAAKPHTPGPGIEQLRTRRIVARLSGPVLILGSIAFASMLCEGASADWASVYLRASVGVTAAWAGLGYTAFSLAMVIMRLMGSRLLTRLSPRRLLPALAGVGAAGFVGGLLGGISVTVIAGFACLGVGLALVIPSVNSAAGRLPGISQGTAIAMVSACGWAGFVFGPPIIGELASASSLTAALVILPVLTACIAVAIGRARALHVTPSG